MLAVTRRRSTRPRTYKNAATRDSPYPLFHDEFREECLRSGGNDDGVAVSIVKHRTSGFLVQSTRGSLYIFATSFRIRSALPNDKSSWTENSFRFIGFCGGLPEWHLIFAGIPWVRSIIVFRFEFGCFCYSCRLVFVVEVRLSLCTSSLESIANARILFGECTMLVRMHFEVVDVCAVILHRLSDKYYLFQ